MKKNKLLEVSFLAYMMLFCISHTAFAQSVQSAVTLKNGTVLVGIIKAITPAKDVTLEIAGVETTFPMDDIAKIENASNTFVIQEAEDEEIPKIRITDFSGYPETVELKVGEHTFKMILVRGGEMQMGYSGRHSMKYDSEPIHKVRVTSFYMSDEFIPNDVVKALSIPVRTKGKTYFKNIDYEKHQLIIDAIVAATNLPVRIPTEAEWEYAACSAVRSQLFAKCSSGEFCSDKYGDYSNEKVETDPTGPSKGSYRTARAYFKGDEIKYQRYKIVNRAYQYGKYDLPSRIVIKAKELLAPW